MPSTYSTSLGFELPATGEQSGTWGDTVNRNVGTLIEEAIAGVETVAMADANVTLTSTSGASNQARNAVIVATGANTATRDLIIPAVTKVYIVSSSTSGGQSVRIKTATGTAVTIANGIKSVVYCDGATAKVAAAKLFEHAGIACALVFTRFSWLLMYLRRPALSIIWSMASTATLLS